MNSKFLVLAILLPVALNGADCFKRMEGVGRTNCCEVAIKAGQLVGLGAISVGVACVGTAHPELTALGAAGLVLTGSLFVACSKTAFTVTPVVLNRRAMKFK